MNEGWIIFGLCVLTLIGATLPLLHERRSQSRRPTDKNKDKHGT